MLKAMARSETMTILDAEVRALVTLIMLMFEAVVELIGGQSE